LKYNASLYSGFQVTVTDTGQGITTAVGWQTAGAARAAAAAATATPPRPPTSTSTSGVRVKPKNENGKNF